MVEFKLNNLSIGNALAYAIMQFLSILSYRKKVADASDDVQGLTSQQMSYQGLQDLQSSHLSF